MAGTSASAPRLMVSFPTAGVAGGDYAGEVETTVPSSHRLARLPMLHDGTRPMITHVCPVPQIVAATAEQMAEVDRIMTEELGVDLLQMMELAGSALAILARDRFLGGDPRGKRVLVLAGSGGNGGGGMAAARRLHGWCAEVEVWVTRETAFLRGAAANQVRSLRALGVPVHVPPESSLPAADLIVDALIGYSLAGPPSGHTAALIRAANDHPEPVLSLDLPSGLDATIGTVFDPCIQADVTLALALPKRGAWAPWGHGMTGELYLADIGIPQEVYARLGLDVGPIFARQHLLRIG